VRVGGNDDGVADGKEEEELLGKGGQGWNGVGVDHQRELKLVQSCLESGVRWDHRSRGVATRE